MSSGESHGGVGLAAGVCRLRASNDSCEVQTMWLLAVVLGRCHPYVFGASRDVIVSSSPRFALWTDAALELPSNVLALIVQHRTNVCGHPQISSAPARRTAKSLTAPLQAA